MMVSKRRPTHPGQILKHIYLEPLELSITELARRLGVSRKAVSAIVSERKSVTPEMALRFQSFHHHPGAVAQPAAQPRSVASRPG
jgi:addiction module HigA family antidote